MAREDLHFRLRIPEDLKTRIEAEAGANNRSMTAEIVSRLENSFSPSEDLAKSEYVRKIQADLLESYGSQNSILKRMQIVNERLLFELATAIAKAAEGDRSEIERLIEQERQQPSFRRIKFAELDDGIG